MAVQGNGHIFRGEIAVTFRYEGIIEITQILADETSKRLRVSKKLGVELGGETPDRYTWSFYSHYKWPYGN